MRLPATTESVERLMAALEEYAEAAALGPRAAHHLVLLAEELAANVVMHGTRGPSPATWFAVTVRREGEALHLVLEDDGPAFDPLALAAPDVSAGLEERGEGGLGIHLVRRLSRQAEYRRQDSGNRIALTLDAMA